MPGTVIRHLKIKLARELNRSAGLRIGASIHGLINGIDVAEERAGAVVANWIGKVRVIEGVVRFQSQLNVARASLSAKRKVLVDLNVGVIESRAMKEVPLHIAKSADWLLGEGRRIKPKVSGSPRIERLDVKRRCVGSVRALHKAELIAIERIEYAAVIDGDGEAGLERSDSRNMPSAQGSARDLICSDHLRQRDSIVIEADQPLTRIVSRIAITQMLEAGEGIDIVAVRNGVLEAGGIIQRVAIGIRKRKIQSMSGGFGQRYLQRVIVGIAVRVHSAD